MKRITFRADSDLIDAARTHARARGTTMNELFREWLADYTQKQRRADEAMAVIDRIRSYARTGGRKFTRDEMNER